MIITQTRPVSCCYAIALYTSVEFRLRDAQAVDKFIGLLDCEKEILNGCVPTHNTTKKFENHFLYYNNTPEIGTNVINTKCKTMRKIKTK